MKWLTPYGLTILLTEKKQITEGRAHLGSSRVKTMRSSHCLALLMVVTGGLLLVYPICVDGHPSTRAARGPWGTWREVRGIFCQTHKIPIRTRGWTSFLSKLGGVPKIDLSQRQSMNPQG